MHRWHVYTLRDYMKHFIQIDNSKNVEETGSQYIKQHFKDSNNGKKAQGEGEAEPVEVGKGAGWVTARHGDTSGGCCPSYISLWWMTTGWWCRRGAQQRRGQGRNWRVVEILGQVLSLKLKPQVGTGTLWPDSTYLCSFREIWYGVFLWVPVSFLLVHVPAELLTCSPSGITNTVQQLLECAEQQQGKKWYRLKPSPWALDRCFVWWWSPFYTLYLLYSIHPYAMCGT